MNINNAFRKKMIMKQINLLVKSMVIDEVVKSTAEAKVAVKHFLNQIIYILSQDSKKE